MRILIHQALIGNVSQVANQAQAVYEAVGGKDSPRIWESGALGVGDVPSEPATPYILISELNPISYESIARDTLPGALSHNFQVWVCDERGDMLDIDNILDAVRETVVGLTLAVSPSGARCAEARFQGYSADTPLPATLRVLPETRLSQVVSRFALFKLTANK